MEWNVIKRVYCECVSMITILARALEYTTSLKITSSACRLNAHGIIVKLHKSILLHYGHLQLHGRFSKMAELYE